MDFECCLMFRLDRQAETQCGAVKPIRGFAIADKTPDISKILKFLNF